MKRPCQCDRCERGAPYRRGLCRLCWLYHHDDAYNRLWGGTGVVHLPPPRQELIVPARQPLAPPAQRPRCRHLGEPTGEQQTCATCRGSVRLKLFSCAHPAHGTCTPTKALPGVACCATCPDHAPAVPIHPIMAFRARRAAGTERAGPPPGLALPTRRNLLMHLYPRRGSCWRWHADFLLPRLPLFNGRRIVAVARDETTEDPAEVRRAFKDQVEVFSLPNDPRRLETVTFEALYSQVESTDPHEVSVWVHGKGSSGRTVTWQRWATVMYEALLDYWPHTEAVLSRCPCAGSFRKIGMGWSQHESASDWHYSGSFWAFRHADLFARDWRHFEDSKTTWQGIEPYPSVHFALAEAGVLFTPPTVSWPDLYLPWFWERIVEPAWAAWQAEHAGERTSLSACALDALSPRMGGEP